MNKHRVPVPVNNPLDKDLNIQVNHCRMPDCDNYGIPAKTEHIKPGPNKDGDKHYKITSTNKGSIPAILCKCCGEKAPVKSNEGIVSEIKRLSDYLKRPEDKCCNNKNCPNHTKSVLKHPKLYYKDGYRKGSGFPMRKCKSCGSKITLAQDTVKIHPKNQHFASDIYSRVVNKSPMRRTVKGIGKNPEKAYLYYNTLKFIERRCNRLSGTIERKMLDGEITLPKSLSLSTDIQEYRLNWTNRHDKRNPVFSAIATVDNKSNYLFALHANYDKDIDAFAINKESALSGDLERKEAFRKYAQYWLAGDEFHSGRANAMKLGLDKSKDIIKQIQDVYSAAQSREDIEDSEMWAMNPDLHNPKMAKGLQVHIPYVSYAHFYIMQKILKGAGVENIQYSMDCESMFRASFLCTFKNEVKQGKAHAFYVRHQKYLTVNEREYKIKHARSRLNAFARQLPEDKQREAKLLLMKHNLKNLTEHGKWSEKWAVHPVPTMNEPDKMVCCLTPNNTLSLDEKAQMYLNTGLGAIDNIFQLTRRHMNALERPIGTSSGYNTVAWLCTL